MSDATSATPPAGGAPPANPPAPTPAWHGIADETTAAWVANKGWKTPADVIASYQNAEKVIGRDPATLVPIPRADDPAGFRAVMAKLGLPETPDKYEFAAPGEGFKPDEAYLGWARQTFHDLGLTAGQVKTLTAKHNEFVKSTLDGQLKDYETKTAADKQALQREWGGGYERMAAAAKAAANSLGFTQPMIDAMEQSVGYSGTMKFFADLGKKMGEDGFVGGDGQPKFNGQLTPAEAKVRWDEARLDPNFTKALTDKQHPGHKAAKEKQAALFAVMYPT